MTTHECPQLSLVEALHDGRLGPQEGASVERHIAVCQACRELARDLDAIGEAVRAPDEPLSPLEHQRARQALLQRATRPALPDDRRRGTYLVMMAAAAALALVVGWAGARATTQSAPLFALHTPAAARPAPPRETTLRPSDDARFERAKSDTLEVVTLTHGALDVTVRRLLPHERFVVRTRDAEVEVHGTAFRIEAGQGRIRHVAVHEGSVEVRYAGFSAIIPQGGSWRATDASTAGNGNATDPSTGAEKAEPATADNGPTAAREPSNDARSASRAATETGSASRAAPNRGATAARATPATAARERSAESAKPDAAKPDAAKPETAKPETEAPATRATSPAARDFAEAIQAVGRGEHGAAVARLQAFSRDYPADARSDEADYLLAIALQRAGRTDEARAAAQRYLADRPNGAHRPQAQAIARR